MKKLWLSLAAATMIAVPSTIASAQDTPSSPAEQPSGEPASNGGASDEASSDGAVGSTEGSPEPASDDDDDDDDDDEGSRRGEMIPPASELNMMEGSELMPASALNGDQIGLPPVSLSSQVITPLVIGSKEDPYAVSAKDFVIRAGQPYRWDIVSEGGVEYKFHAPMLWRNVWMNQIVIEDREIHMAGVPGWLEFDTQGPITVQFQTIRPGRYEWYVEGLRGEGMEGTVTVVP